MAHWMTVGGENKEKDERGREECLTAIHRVGGEWREVERVENRRNKGEQ